MPKVIEADIRDRFIEHMKSPQVDRDLRWLEKQTGISYSHLYYIFVKKERSLTDQNRELMNQIFGTNFK